MMFVLCVYVGKILIVFVDDVIVECVFEICGVLKMWKCVCDFVMCVLKWFGFVMFEMIEGVVWCVCVIDGLCVSEVDEVMMCVANAATRAATTAYLRCVGECVLDVDGDVR